MRLVNQRGCDRREKKIRGSFSLWDLVVILVVVAFFGTWFVFEHSGERSRIARCAGNLRVLGEAMQSYANDHDDSLPAATINLGKNCMSTWDLDLNPYLVPSLANGKSVYDKKQLLEAAGPWFFCPSDPFQRVDPRSYAMSGFDMNPKNWPPKADDETGIGLLWDKKTVPELLGGDIAQEVVKTPDSLPKLKLSILPAPANTLFLTELIASRNILGSVIDTRVFYTRQQEQSLNGDSSKFHFGKFNYLMVDGHVELMTPSETGDSGGKRQTGIWAISGGNGR